jgi:tetratricopeptide (TPR) repeat protein
MAQTIFHEAMLAYAEKRYGDTETLLQSAIQSAPGSIDINYYLGICRLLGDRANEAIEPLQLVLTKEKSPYSQSAHFYLGKAYLQMRDITHAQSELELAAAVPGRLTAEATSTLARLRAVLVFESEKKEETIQGPHKKN